jgi:hypothetical protein
MKPIEFRDRPVDDAVRPACAADELARFPSGSCNPVGGDA